MINSIRLQRSIAGGYLRGTSVHDGVASCSSRGNDTSVRRRWTNSSAAYAVYTGAKDTGFRLRWRHHHHPVAAPTTTAASFSSSSSDRKSQMARDNAAALRAMRKEGGGGGGANTTARAGASASSSGDDVDRIDYRYRGGGGGGGKTDDSNNPLSAASSAPSDLWGEGAKRAEMERQEQNDMRRRRLISDDAKSSPEGESLSPQGKPSAAQQQRQRKFVSFFDEVDAIMEKNRSEEHARRRRKKRDDSGAGGGNRLALLLDRLDDDELSSQENEGGERGGGGGGGGGTPRYGYSLFDDAAFPSETSGKARSIFDTSPSSEPPPPPPRNPNAYDEELFEQYEGVMRDILQSDKLTLRHTKKALPDDYLKPVFKWLMKNERLTPYELPTLCSAVKEGITREEGGAGENEGGDSALDVVAANNAESSLASGKFRSELRSQRQTFLEESGLTSDQYDTAARALSVLADFCAKRARSAPLELAWGKIKEAGMILDVKAMSTYLYVVGTGSGITSLSSSLSGRRAGPAGRSSLSMDSLFGPRGSLVEEEEDAPSDEADDDEDDQEEVLNVPEEVAVFHDLLYKPTENSISLRVKALIAKGDAKGAETLLEQFKSGDGTVRLRSYLPILTLYCEQGDVSSALKLFKRMRNTPSVLLEPENYILLIASLAENGCFRDDYDPIEGAEALGYSSTCGPDLFDLLVGEMAEDVLEVTSASARRLYNSLARGFKDQNTARNLKEMHSLAGMLPMSEAAEDDELVASRVSIDEATAVCPRTKATLRLIMLEKPQRQQLIASLQQLANTEHKRIARGKGDRDHASRELARFAEWLDTRSGEPYTAIIDGANVAYYMQNFDQGKFNFHQIQFLVDALVKMNENPLVIIPHKYGFNSFTATTGITGENQRLSKKEMDVRKNLSQSGRLFRVPPRCLDDYYWMLASVSDQSNSRNGVDLDVPPENEEGRWPGTRPMLVSNDQMRDHRLELLEPRLFRRWYSCHIVNYNFTAFVDDECVDREIGFSTPDFFSREIQSNSTRAGTSWHFPVSDWDLDDRFCIRLPRSNA